MADTEKQNFRYPVERWRIAIEKTKTMREMGYDIDMTKVLVSEVDRVIDESVTETAERLGLVAAPASVSVWRKPYSRTEVEQ